MEARDLSIHMPPVRSQFSPMSIHQTHETSEWLSSEQRSKKCGVLDTLLLIAQSPKLLKQHTLSTLNLLEALG